MVLIPDPTVFVTNRQADYGQLPGQPTWGPFLSAKQAQERESKMYDLHAKIEWDRKADARQAAWESSPFYKAFEQVSL